MISKFFKYLFFAVLVFLIIITIILANSYKDLKNTASQALNSKRLLEAAVSSASVKDWETSLKTNQEAQNEINGALASTQKIKEKKVFSSIFLLERQMSDLEYLLKTAYLISSSLDEVLPIAQKLDSLYEYSSEHTFSSLPTEKKQEFFQIIYESEPEINGLRANLNLAKINLSKIRKIGILYPVYEDISDLKDEISTVSSLLTKTAPLMRLLPALAGYPSASDFLLIMQNTDELRPGGGFIGVYGLMQTENGEIEHLQTHDSYHLDMPSVGVWNMDPPLPIKKYMSVQNWYMRDANWSPDWPTSARKIQEIYYGESKVTGKSHPDFTGIIGITPSFVSDLLALVGPIEVDGEVYNQDNLQELLQYSVEVAYLQEGIPEWDRKEVINELLEELKNRLLNLNTSRLNELLLILENNIAKKDLQLYFNNSAWQVLVEEIGADGRVLDTENDYLLVVDANLAAFKSDAVVRKSINYKVVFPDNSAEAELNINYDHQGGFDWRTTRYRSYTRVYVPLGSDLLEIKATGRANLESGSINSYNDLSLNKTVFGFFFSVEPGSEGGIHLKYDLPKRIYQDWQNNNYHLNLQKQAGRRTDDTKIIIGSQSYQRFLDRDLIISP